MLRPKSVFCFSPKVIPRSLPSAEPQMVETKAAERSLAIPELEARTQASTGPREVIATFCFTPAWLPNSAPVACLELMHLPNGFHNDREQAWLPDIRSIIDVDIWSYW